AFIPIIGNYIAEQKGLQPEELAQITTDNAKRFFHINS
ncbi:MAG: TatD family hydrolase, partial [Victivallales bacterium]|nr:TatD family hydrolase [Victivallales bacterium]